MRYLLLVAVLLLAQISNGQIAKNLSLGADGARGNFSSLGLNVKAEIKKDTGKYAWSINSNYRWSEQSPYGTTSMNLYESELYTTANLTKDLGRNWKLMGFTENEKSFQRKINLRSSVGLGFGLSIIKTKKCTLNISELILPEYYSSSSNADMNNFTVRASTRFRFDAIHSLVKVSSITLFQPAIYSDRQVSFNNNLNIRSTNSITLSLNKKYSIGLLYVLSYQGYPYYINKAVSPLQETASIIVGITL
jgi:hypothetical protein